MFRAHTILVSPITLRQYSVLTLSSVVRAYPNLDVRKAYPAAALGRARLMAMHLENISAPGRLDRAVEKTATRMLRADSHKTARDAAEAAAISEAKEARARGTDHAAGFVVMFSYLQCNIKYTV